MIIKDSNLTFVNDYSGAFAAGAPDVTSNSIRIPAFDFRIVNKNLLELGGDDEDSEVYKSAMLVFEGVVSSTRTIKPYTHIKQVEGSATYEIVDGPFDVVNPDQEVFCYQFTVYANSARAWVDWTIVAAAMRVEEITKHTLIDLALTRGIKPEIANAAFEDVDRFAIRVLLDDINSAPDHRLMIPLFCEELIEVAKQKNRLLDIADLLIQKPNRALLKLADDLSIYHTEGCAALIRNIIAAGYDACSAMIFALYDGDAGLVRALLDPSEPVRIYAAKKLEAQNDADGLILCLQNDSARVREIAGWYVGIKKVSLAADALVKAITTEKFTAVGTHAEIEALRAAIWALGVLRINTTRPYFEPLTRHNNDLIRKTAFDALSKLG